MVLVGVCMYVRQVRSGRTRTSSESPCEAHRSPPSSFAWASMYISTTHIKHAARHRYKTRTPPCRPPRRGHRRRMMAWPGTTRGARAGGAGARASAPLRCVAVGLAMAHLVVQLLWSWPEPTALAGRGRLSNSWSPGTEAVVWGGWVSGAWRAALGCAPRSARHSGAARYEEHIQPLPSLSAVGCGVRVRVRSRAGK